MTPFAAHDAAGREAEQGRSFADDSCVAARRYKAHRTGHSRRQSLSGAHRSAIEPILRAVDRTFLDQPLFTPLRSESTSLAAVPLNG